MCRSGDCKVRLVVSSLETSKYKRQVENSHKISGHISLGRFHLNISSTIDAILGPPNFQSVNRPLVLIGRFVKSRERTLYEHFAACLLFRTPKIPCAMFIFFCMTHVLFPLLLLFLLSSLLSPLSVSLGSLSFPFFHHFHFHFFLSASHSLASSSLTCNNFITRSAADRSFLLGRRWDFPAITLVFVWAESSTGNYFGPRNIWAATERILWLIMHHVSREATLALLLSSTFLSFCFKLFNFALSFSWDTIYCWIVLPKKTTTVPFSSCFCIFRVCYFPFCIDFSQEAEHALCEVVVVSVSILGLRNFCTRLCATI